jgi:hypothetical protein
MNWDAIGLSVKRSARSHWSSYSHRFGMRGPSSLEPSRRPAPTALWHQRANTLRNVDLLSAGERTGFETSIRYNYHSHAISRLWYESTRPRLNPEFVRYIDSLSSA